MTDGWIMDAFEDTKLVDCPDCAGTGFEHDSHGHTDHHAEVVDCRGCSGTGVVVEDW